MEPQQGELGHVTLMLGVVGGFPSQGPEHPSPISPEHLLS